MQTIEKNSRHQQGCKLSKLTILGFFFAQMLTPTLAFGGKVKADQQRPQPKTQTKVLASRLAPPVSETERKGKKGLATSLDSVTLGRKTSQTAPLSAARTSREQTPKLNTQTRRVAEKPISPKASTKLAAKTPTTAKAKHLAEQTLTSRLTRTANTPAKEVKPLGESDRRGKFGKRETDSVLADNRRANREEEKVVAPPLPLRRAESASVRETERSPERVEATTSTRPRETNTASDSPAYQILLPDKIEVIEYGSTSSTVAKLLNLSESRPLTPFGAIVTKNNTPPSKRNDLSIPQQRVLEIQYELVKRGFYAAEPNGIYDETTILAMWEFQKNYGLPATGYPSAHALKRLGLTSW